MADQRAALEAARARLDDLRQAARRAEALLDEELETDGDDSPRVAKRRARVDDLRAAARAAEDAAAEAGKGLRIAAVSQLVALRDAGLRAASAEGLEELLDPEARDVAAINAKLVAIGARAVEKVKARRADVDRARLALGALDALGEATSRRDDERALRDLGEVDARRGLGRSTFNKLPVGQPRDAFEWLATQAEYGARNAYGKVLPKRSDGERAATPANVAGRPL